MNKDVDWGAALFGIVASMVFLVFVQGYVLSLLWLWFLVPLGVPAITNFAGAGIVLLVKCISPPKSNHDVTWDAMFRVVFTSCAYQALTLALAYVITLFM